MSQESTNSGQISLSSRLSVGQVSDSPQKKGSRVFYSFSALRLPDHRVGKAECILDMKRMSVELQDVEGRAEFHQHTAKQAK